jgi:hypothetical protein
MSDDARDGIAATVVVAEHLREKAPDGSNRVEHSVPVLDAMIVKDFQDVGFGQNIRKRKSLVARKASADRLQVGH